MWSNCFILSPGFSFILFDVATNICRAPKSGYVQEQSNEQEDPARNDQVTQQITFTQHKAKKKLILKKYKKIVCHERRISFGGEAQRNLMKEVSKVVTPTILEKREVSGGLLQAQGNLCLVQQVDLGLR